MTLFYFKLLKQFYYSKMINYLKKVDRDNNINVLYVLVTTPSDNDSDKPTKAERDKAVPERRTKELDGYVGFANLPNQVYRKAVKKGFDFTLMVVGTSVFTGRLT